MRLKLIQLQFTYLQLKWLNSLFFVVQSVKLQNSCYRLYIYAKLLKKKESQATQINKQQIIKIRINWHTYNNVKSQKLQEFPLNQIIYEQIQNFKHLQAVNKHLYQFIRLQAVIYSNLYVRLLIKTSQILFLSIDNSYQFIQYLQNNIITCYICFEPIQLFQYSIIFKSTNILNKVNKYSIILIQAKQNNIRMNSNLIDSVKVDNQSEFTGITVTIISANDIKFQEPVDQKQLFVRVKIHQKEQYTSKQRMFHQKVEWNESFFYNTSEILDDDVDIQLYVSDQSNQKQMNNSSRVGKSSSKMQSSGKFSGKLIGVKRNIKVSRENRRSKTDRQIILMAQDSDRKQVATVRVHVDYFQRQDIVGGIKCPNLSLRPDKQHRNRLILENKYTQSLNLYSWMDTDTIHQCEFFPRKFKD